MIEQLDRSFSIGTTRAKDPTRCDDYQAAMSFLSFLLTNSAKPRAKDVRDLVLMFNKWVIVRDAWLKAVACADNPFIAGITLSVKLAEAAAISFEGDQKRLLSFQENVNLLLLEILERLPKTVHGLGGLETCAAVFEPEGLPARRTPLGMVLEDRGQMETICPDPLVMDYLLYRFTGALKGLWVQDGIRRNSPSNELPAMTREGDEDFIHACKEGSSGDRGTRSLRRINESKLFKCFKYPSHFSPGSLAIQPKGQFMIAGGLAKPDIYYIVPVMRMLFEIVAYLGFIFQFSYYVLPHDNGRVTPGELVFSLFLLVS